MYSCVLKVYYSLHTYRNHQFTDRQLTIYRINRKSCRTATTATTANNIWRNNVDLDLSATYAPRCHLKRSGREVSFVGDAARVLPSRIQMSFCLLGRAINMGHLLKLILTSCLIQHHHLHHYLDLGIFGLGYSRLRRGITAPRLSNVT